jgi:hypothetical protein
MAAWKTAEQRIARKLQKAAGVVRDEVLRNLVTSTGRVGHLTELGFDILVGNGADGTAIVGEVKRKKYFLSADAVRALLQIFARGIEYGRTPMLGLTLSEDVPGFVDTNRGRKRLERDWLLMPLSKATELIRVRRIVAELSRENTAFGEVLRRALNGEEGIGDKG